jgi:Phosphatidylinositol 3- and 4-kinase
MINRTPDGKFTFGATHADKAEFHRAQQAIFQKRGEAAKRAWVKIRANKEAARLGAVAKPEAPRQATTKQPPPREQPKPLNAGQKAALTRAANRAAKEKEFWEPQPKPAANDSSARESNLRATVVSSKNHGGGVSVVEKLTLENGTVAAFKPASGEPKQFGSFKVMRPNITPGKATEREIGAWKVADLVGMSDMIAPTIGRTVNGQRGAIQEWQKGSPAAEMGYSGKYDGEVGASRAAAFDYVIGNTDRHDGNWLVEGHGANATLHLIDHGLSFPESNSVGRGNRMFLDHAGAADFNGGLRTSPANYAAPFVREQAHIVSALKELGLGQKVLDGVSSRIHALAKAQSWAEIRNAE